MPNLDQLIRRGDLNAIDRIQFRSPPKEEGVLDILALEERSYNPTRWYPFSRIRKTDGINWTMTTCFTNDNLKCPVASLHYETKSEPDKITLTVILRDGHSEAMLAVLLAAKLYKLHNPYRHLPAKISVPKTMVFPNLEEDSSIFEFIGDRMRPVLLIDGKQSEYGAIFFMCEHRKTIKQFTEQDYKQPLAFAWNYMLSFFKSTQSHIMPVASTPVIESVRYSPS